MTGAHLLGAMMVEHEIVCRPAEECRRVDDGAAIFEPRETLERRLHGVVGIGWTIAEPLHDRAPDGRPVEPILGVEIGGGMSRRGGQSVRIRIGGSDGAIDVSANGRSTDVCCSGPILSS